MDPNAMTPAERAATVAAIEADLPVRMLDPRGRPVTVVGRDMVRNRLGAGYQLVEDQP